MGICILEAMVEGGSRRSLVQIVMGLSEEQAQLLDDQDETFYGGAGEESSESSNEDVAVTHRVAELASDTEENLDADEVSARWMKELFYIYLFNLFL